MPDPFHSLQNGFVYAKTPARHQHRTLRRFNKQNLAHVAPRIETAFGRNRSRWVPAPARTRDDTGRDIDRIAFGMDAGSSGRPEDQAAGEPRPAGFRMDDAETLIVTAGELWEALGRQDPTGNLSELQVNLLAQAADRNDDAMCGGGS